MDAASASQRLASGGMGAHVGEKDIFADIELAGSVLDLPLPKPDANQLKEQKKKKKDPTEDHDHHSSIASQLVLSFDEPSKANPLLDVLTSHDRMPTRLSPRSQTKLNLVIPRVSPAPRSVSPSSALRMASTGMVVGEMMMNANSNTRFGMIFLFT